MNSLVVFLSMVALAVAKPSGVFDAGLLTYSSPLLAAAPAAVSSQSRLDIKSSPAVISTQIQPVSQTVISEPAFFTAPAYAKPAAYVAPTVYAAPAAYAAPLAVAAPAAVSHQSRLDIKSTPAVTSTYVSAPVGYSASIAAPAAWSAYAAPLAVAAPAAVSQQSRLDIKSSPAIANTVLSAYGAPLATAAIAPAFVKTAFAAPLIESSAFVKTAEIVPAAIGAPAVPLDTPEVIAARAAHFEAKALAEGHLIRKRSVLAAPLLNTQFATPVVSTYAAPSVISTYSAPIYSAPLSYSAAISNSLVAKTYGIHPW